MLVCLYVEIEVETTIYYMCYKKLYRNMFQTFDML